MKFTNQLNVEPLITPRKAFVSSSIIFINHTKYVGVVRKWKTIEALPEHEGSDRNPVTGTDSRDPGEKHLYGVFGWVKNFALIFTESLVFTLLKVRSVLLLGHEALEIVPVFDLDLRHPAFERVIVDEGRVVLELGVNVEHSARDGHHDV